MRHIIVDENGQPHDIERSVYSFELKLAEITNLIVVIVWHQGQPITIDKEIDRAVLPEACCNIASFNFKIKHRMCFKEFVNEVLKIKIRNVDIASSSIKNGVHSTLLVIDCLISIFIGL